MDNHFHLLLVTGKTSLADFMRSLLTGYAIYYNTKYKRIGHLFANRYKSVLCNGDEYLLSLIRYIHLNPVKAKIRNINTLASYLWTGHRELINPSNNEALIDVKEVLGYFGRTEKGARNAYVEFINDGLGLKEDYEGGGLIRSSGGYEKVIGRKFEEREMYDERILGDGDFVGMVYQQLDIKEEQVNKNDINKITKNICGYYGIKKDTLLTEKTKPVREARNVFMFLSNKYSNKSLTELGKMLNIRPSAASLARKKGQEICINNRLEEKIIV